MASPNSAYNLAEHDQAFGRERASVVGGWTALALWLAFSGIYLLTLSNNYSQDGMAFAVLATRNDLQNPLFFQAEHILHPLVGWLWFDLWRFLGYQEGALRPLQSLNALAGAAGVAFFYLAVRHLLQGWRWVYWGAVIASLLVASSNAYWFHATEGEDQIIAHAFLMVGFYALVRLHTLPVAATDQRRKYLGVFVIAWGISVLFNATEVLFAPVAILGLRRAGLSWKPAIAGIMGAGLVALVPFLVVGLAIHQLRAPAEFLGWALAAPGNGVWGRVGIGNLMQGARTLAGSIFAQGELSGVSSLLRGNVSPSAYVSYLLMAVVWVGLILMVAHWIAYVRIERASGSIATRSPLPDAGWGLTCWVWIVTYCLFNLYWAPEDFQFWIALLPPLVILALLTARHLWETRAIVRPFLPAVGLAGVLVVFGYNYVGAMAPRHDLASNLDYTRASCLATVTDEHDLVVSPGWDWTTTYLPYFSQRSVFSLADNYLLVANGNRDELFALLSTKANETWSSGRKVYIVRLFDLAPDQRAWLQRITTTAPDDYQFLGPKAVAAACGGETVWEIAPR